MEAVSFYPALIDIRETWAPEIFPPNSPEGQRVITLLSDISQRFNTKFVVKGEEVVIDVSK
jgi:hypothetical protein